MAGLWGNWPGLPPLLLTGSWVADIFGFEEDVGDIEIPSITESSKTLPPFCPIEEAPSPDQVSELSYLVGSGFLPITPGDVGVDTRVSMLVYLMTG